MKAVDEYHCSGAITGGTQQSKGRLVYLGCWVFLTLNLCSTELAAQQTGPDTVYDVNVAAANAAEALNSLARQTGVALLFPYDLARSRQANGVKGKYTLQQALDLILQDTGLSGDLSDKGVLTISRVGSDEHNSGGEVMQQEQNRRSMWTSLIAGIAAVLAGPVGIQNVAAQTLEEIVVTAQRREQSLQDVPLSVAAFSEDTLRSLSLNDGFDIFAYTPGLVSAPGYASPLRVAIRGVGSRQFGYSFDNPVGVFVDGVFQEGLATASEYYDIQRVEVIRGPVGALFGRSAIAGAISVTRNKPNEKTGGRLDAGIGEIGRESVTAVFNTPLSDNVYFRIAGKYDDTDGYLKNVTDGRKIGETSVKSVRAALRYLDDSLDATLTATYEDRRDLANMYQMTSPLTSGSFLGVPLQFLVLAGHEDLSQIQPFSGDTHKVAAIAGFEPKFDSDFFDITAEINYNFTEQLKLKSLTNYRDHDTHYAEDFGGTGVADLTFFGPFEQEFGGDLVQQEFHVSYTTDNNWELLFGASYYDKQVDAVNSSGISDGFGTFFLINPLNPGGANAVAVGDTVIQTELTEVESSGSGWSAFFDLTVPLTERLDVIFGARHSYDEKDHEVFIPQLGTIPGNLPTALPIFLNPFTSVPVSESDDWSGTTVRAALSFDLFEDINLYASYAQGYKSGGIDNTLVYPVGVFPPLADDAAAVGAVPTSVDEESSDSFELGMKSFWLDRRLQFNISGFYYEFEDQQRLEFVGGVLSVLNIGEVEGAGFEADLRVLPVDNLDISANIGYLHSEIKADEIVPGNVGERTEKSPEWSGSIVATYRYPFALGELYGTYSFTYQDSMRVSEIPTEPFLPSIELSNIRLGYESEGAKWGVSVYVNNLFDNFVYYDHRFADPAVDPTDRRNNLGYDRHAGMDVYFSF